MKTCYVIAIRIASHILISPVNDLLAVHTLISATISHSALLEKLQAYGIERNEYQWFCSYLFNRKNFVSDGQTISNAEPVTCGVPQGSILGPLLFIIFINDLSDQMQYVSTIMYADDTVLFLSHKKKSEIERCLNKDMENLLHYFRQNELVINLKPGKTETMLFGTCKRLKNAGGELEVLYNNVKISFTKTYKYLGNILDSNMNFSLNFDASYKNTSGRLRLLEQMRCYLTTKAARLVYVMMIVPIVTAGCTLKSPYNATQSAKLLSLDRRAKKIVGANDTTPLESLANRERCLLVKKCLTQEMNDKFNQYFKVLDHKINTRNNTISLKIPPAKLEIFKNTFYFSGTVLYNSLPNEIRKVDSYRKFKECIDSFLITFDSILTLCYENYFILHSLNFLDLFNLNFNL